jgi:hypothetical protein
VYQQSSQNHSRARETPISETRNGESDSDFAALRFNLQFQDNLPFDICISVGSMLRALNPSKSVDAL